MASARRRRSSVGTSIDRTVQAGIPRRAAPSSVCWSQRRREAHSAHLRRRRRRPLKMFFSTELLNAKGPMGQIWILANMPQRAGKLTRHKAAGISVVESCMQIIEPKAPLALRLAAVLMRGVVALYNRQLYFLHEDATNCLLRLKSHFVAHGADKNVLEERRQQARPEQVTREVDAFELMQLLDYAAGDSYDGALYGAASQGADSFFLVDEAALRALEEGAEAMGGAGAGRGAGRGAAARRRGPDINLPGGDLLTGDGEDAVSGGTSLSGGRRSAFAPYDEEEFEALPDDVEEGGFAAPAGSGGRAASLGAGSGRAGSDAFGGGGGGLARIGEDDFFEDAAPPPPDADDEFAPLPEDEEELKDGADDEDEPAPKRARKQAAAKRANKKGILRFSMPSNEAVELDGDVFRAWLSNASDLLCQRPQVGGGVAGGRVSARLDAALHTPSMLLLDPWGDDAGVAPPGAKRPRHALCDALAAVFARHAAPLKRRRGAAPASPSASLAASAEDVEAFRDDAAASVDGVPLPSPGGSHRTGGAAAAAFGRRSGLSGGSGSLLQQALAGVSPTSGPARPGRGSDAFGGVRPGDLPGGADDELFNGGAAFGDDYDAVAPPEEDGGAGWGGFGGGGGGGLSAQFESLLETAPDATQTQRGPAAALSGVSKGVVDYFAAAFTGDAASQTAAFTFADLCSTNGLNRTQRAQFFAQVLILASNAHVRVQQDAPYDAIMITKGTAPLVAAA